MRIAVPFTRGVIAQHPGHCEAFLVADVEAGAVTRERELTNPGHGPGGPPPLFLAGEGVSELLAWGLPVEARDKFAALGIRVRLGATGEPRKALREYLAGTLLYVEEGLDGGGACAGHDHGRGEDGVDGEDPDPDPELDVREVAARDRHGLIFRKFGGLEAGQAFVLVNDHDPKPLYYQLAAEQAGRFSWDYLAQGPEVWRVRIGRV
ncbi:MAG TPA: DUF2249 domain-containing protein [Myxococcales bacterium]|jgi:uncharacterized protein (DUF2249 family)/predicted Fe-Mo cluster-binding NifX family protein